MLSNFVLAILLPPLLILGWAAVQRAWRRQFDSTDDDVLAGRSDCGRCSCAGPCHREDDRNQLTHRRSEP